MRVVVFYHQSMGERCSSIRCRLVDPQKRRPFKRGGQPRHVKIVHAGGVAAGDLGLTSDRKWLNVPSPDMISTAHLAPDDWCISLVHPRNGATPPSPPLSPSPVH